jgi:predicted nucleic acid-binding protein
MARILSDTNIWLRVADPGAVQHDAAVQAVARLLVEGHEVCICAQNLIEFWAVATRPVLANGLGWTPLETASEMEGLESRFTFLPDTPEIFQFWKTLVQSFAVQGKRTHDARLAAVYLAHKAEALLTLNLKDFQIFPALHLLDPMQPEGWSLPDSPASD